MTRVGVISDTHGLLRPEVLGFLHECDLIIHAGDFTCTGIYNTLQGIAPLYAVRGNNDLLLINQLPTFRAFRIEGLSIALIHDKRSLTPSRLEGIQLVISGHTHQYCERRIGGRLWLNPGSCGHRRFGTDLTMAFLLMDKGRYQIQRMELNV